MIECYAWSGVARRIAFEPDPDPASPPRDPGGDDRP